MHFYVPIDLLMVAVDEFDHVLMHQTSIPNFFYKILVVLYLLFLNLIIIVWILMGFFEGIPVDIEEAAAIDGLSPIGTLLRIVIPISTPGILSSAILSFIMCWNEFLFALILTGSKTSTVPVSLAAMVTQRGVLIGKLSAGTAIAIIPMIIISIFVKKYLVQGLTLGAIK